MGDSNKSLATLFFENKPLVWFIAISLIAILGYLVYNKWEIVVGSTALKPPERRGVEVPNEPNEVEKSRKPEKPMLKEPFSELQAPPLTNQQDRPKTRVNISLIVDAEFENGDIFINEKQVYPIKETPTIKYLEIEYQPTIRVEVKSRNRTCSVKKSISESELNHQIQLICIQ